MDGHFSYAKPIRELVTANFPRDVETFNLRNLFACKFSDAVTLAVHSPMLLRHVRKVYRSRSFEKVARVAAGWIIATMASVIRAGIDAVVQPIRHAVRSILDSLNPKASVTISRIVHTSKPRPAFIGGANINGGPKAFSVLRGYFGKNTILNRHDVTSSTGDVVLGPQAVYSAPLRLVYYTTQVRNRRREYVIRSIKVREADSTGGVTPTTGLANVPCVVLKVTSGTFNPTTAGLFASLSCTTAASTVLTFQQVIAEAINL